jgi:hypothetical protein
MYITYYDMIRAHITNLSQISECATRWQWPMHRGFGAVLFFDAVIPVVTVPVPF